MNEKELVRKLVAGSEAIDRMRHEIGLVIKSVRELLQPADFLDFVWERQLTCFVIRGDTVDWDVHLEVGKGLCIRAVPFRSGQCIYLHDTGATTISPKNVRLVHTALPFFVSEMVQHFPKLNDALQPLLDAADTQ
jgi:hypothetical protein